MIIDKELVFSEAQAVTATASSTNIVDLGVGDTGVSKALTLVVDIPTVFTGTGTIVITFNTGSAMSAGAITSPTVMATFSPTNAQIKAGGRMYTVPLPIGMKRYCDLTYTVDGTVAAGKITAFLVMDLQTNDNK